MHEISLVKRLLTQVLRLAIEHDAIAVERVNIRVGEFAGIEPTLLVSAFAQAAAGTIAATALLDIQQMVLTVRCRCCNRRFSPVGFRFQCDHCPGADVEIVAGEDLVLENIVLTQATKAEVCQ